MCGKLCPDKRPYMKTCGMVCRRIHYAALPSNNPTPSLARSQMLMARARRSGRIAPPVGKRCADCGRPAECYDHRDYRYPYQITPVCRSCNIRRGPAIGSPTVKTG